ncbi:hypothetical protein L3Q82_026305 [Scortum barcoo]|uniref:Uncharacterized protein n=1 Tax=Scortum barcoo TaxID=214431 RepID=A0ACB8WIF5_9TELE|nr:hypothetical protein L3Q82_026305 [Scortum barcoo]
MIDFVVISSDLRPYVLDTRGLLGTSWPSPLSGRSSTPTSGRASHRFRGRLGTLSLSGPCSLPPLSDALAVRSCGRKVSGACRGRQSPNPVVDTGSKGCRQAEEGVLSAGTMLACGTPDAQLTGTGRPSKPQPGTVLEAKTRVWEEFGEAMEEDYRSASKRFWQTVRRLRRGKQYSANTVYSAGGELLTSNWGHCRTVEEILRGSPQSHRLAFQ